MDMNMTRSILTMGKLRAAILVVLAVGFLVGISVGGVLADSNDAWTAMTTPPDDSLEASNVRIWLPVERGSSCRVGINIHNDSGQVVRHLLNKPLRKGYYNFYWDKKDDSGQVVGEGVYGYVADLCGLERTGELTVSYKPGERQCILYPESDSLMGIVEFDLLEDSSVVSISICFMSGKEVYSPVIDSIMNAGRHVFRWQPKTRVIPTLYRFELTLKDFVHKTEIHKPR